MTRKNRQCPHVWRNRTRWWSRNKGGIILACSACRRRWGR